MEARGPDSNGAAGPLPRTDDGVRLVRWPDELPLLEQLRRGARSAGTPGSGVGTRARGRGLRRGVGAASRRRRGHPGSRGRRCHAVGSSPADAAVDDDGRLKRDGAWIALSPIELRLARELIEHFGEVVDSRNLTAAAWPRNGHGDHDGALHVHLTRLRRRLRPLALDVQNVRGRGYVMEHSEQDPSH